MSWIVDAFEPGFMQRALVAGSLSAVVAALVGTWVVLRGMTFLGDALAHGVLPGIAAGVVLGFDPTFGAIASALVMVAGIDLVHRHSRLGEDAGIGLLFVGMLALGVVVISRSASYTGDLASILFGDALAVDDRDLWMLAVATLISVVATVVFYRSFLALSFDRQKAEALGMHPRAAHVAMLALVTMVVVASFRTVGSLLVFGLLVAPPATAGLVARRVPVMMGTAAAIGVAAVAAGLLVSYHADTAASATIAALAVGTFFVVLAGKALVSRT